MYAIINKGNGHYYTSAVFGYYNDKIEKYGSWKQYLIVLDESKTKLIRFSEYDQKKMPHLYKMALFTDGDQSDWSIDEHGYGGVSFISKDDALNYVRTGTPADVLAQCLEYDRRNPYSEIQSIETAKDIDNLMWASGYFHDAYIKEISSIADGVRVLFDGVWGCRIEVTFSGDVSYNTDSRDPEEYDPYWFGSTVAFHNGYIYMVDEDEMDIDEITNGYCWFRAKHMSYRIIPDES